MRLTKRSILSIWHLKKIFKLLKMTKPKLVELPKYLDERGNLSFVQQFSQIPFEIKRVYWIYDVPGGESRGGHAYKENTEFIIAMSGSFDVLVDDGIVKDIYSLNRSYYGLLIPKGLWREIKNFSTNSLAMIISSTMYDEHDYIRNYDEYRNFVKNEKI